MKKPEGKPIVHYFYNSALYATVKVREYGVTKHGSEDGWKTTTHLEHLDAAIRHIRADMEGEQSDKESGYLHLAHAMCNLMFEIERYATEHNYEELSVRKILQGGK